MMTSQQEPATALLLINEKSMKGACTRKEVLAQLTAQGLRVIVPNAEMTAAAPGMVAV
ncbi:MAG: hypothetical protein ACR5LF_05445 [Symbiopectobacterium sp.]